MVGPSGHSPRRCLPDLRHEPCPLDSAQFELDGLLGELHQVGPGTSARAHERRGDHPDIVGDDDLHVLDIDRIVGVGLRRKIDELIGRCGGRLGHRQRLQSRLVALAESCCP